MVHVSHSKIRSTCCVLCLRLSLLYIGVVSCPSTKWLIFTQASRILGGFLHGNEGAIKSGTSRKHLNHPKAPCFPNFSKRTWHAGGCLLLKMLKHQSYQSPKSPSHDEALRPINAKLQSFLMSWTSIAMGPLGHRFRWKRITPPPKKKHSPKKL